LETKNWQVRGEKYQRNLQNKKKIKDIFKNAKGFFVNTIKPGGNTVIRHF